MGTCLPNVASTRLHSAEMQQVPKRDTCVGAGGRCGFNLMMQTGGPKICKQSSNKSDAALEGGCSRDHRHQPLTEGSNRKGGWKCNKMLKILILLKINPYGLLVCQYSNTEQDLRACSRHAQKPFKSSICTENTWMTTLVYSDLFETKKVIFVQLGSNTFLSSCFLTFCNSSAT